MYTTTLYCSQPVCRETGGQVVFGENMVGVLASWSDKSDAELLGLIQNGSHHAFSQIVQRHNKKFYSLAYRYTGARETAEDVVQEAFIKLWEHPEMWDDARGSKFTTWFYKIIVNLCLDQKKKKRTLPLDEKIEIADERELQDGNTAAIEIQRILENEILALPDAQRTALNLCFYEGISNKEAAEIMGTTLKSVQSLLMRAKKNLKDKLKDFI